MLGAFLAVVGLTVFVSAASVQHHPFSEIFPPDDNLNFKGQDILNVSKIEANYFVPNESDIVFRDSGDIEVLRLNSSSGNWVYNNSNIDLNGQNITSSGGEVCIGEYC